MLALGDWISGLWEEKYTLKDPASSLVLKEFPLKDPKKALFEKILRLWDKNRFFENQNAEKGQDT
jgi:hypothetical protein